jgi:hypothetical protein
MAVPVTHPAQDTFDHPILTAVIIIGVIGGVIFLLRSRFPAILVSASRLIPSSKVLTGSASDQAKASSTSPKKSSDFPWLGWSAALLALVLVVGWVHYEWNSIVPYFQIKDHVPHGTPIPTTPHSPDGQPILVSTPEAGPCTEPAQTVPVSGDETVWVDVPAGCVVHAWPGKYELFCKDLSGDEHPWTEQYCSSYLALGFKKKSDDDSDSDDEDTPLEIPISFETRTSTTVP